MEEKNHIIEIIKNQNIKPKPKWYFIFKNTIPWIFYFIFMLIGAISFSVVLFSVQQTDFELLSHLGHSRLELFLSIMPFIWLISLILFISGSLFAIYNSKKGYKFTFSKLISINVGLSIILGTIFFIGGGAAWFENAFAIRTGFYESIQNRKQKIWQNPQKGNLAGVIYKVKNSEWEIIDFENKKWTIYIDSAFVANAVTIEEGEKIKMIGSVIDDSSFKAKEIYPWGGKETRRKMKKRRNKY